MRKDTSRIVNGLFHTLKDGRQFVFINNWWDEPDYFIAAIREFGGVWCHRPLYYNHELESY